ncbi:MAG TPA: flagellar hook-associated protein FlgL [Nitrospiria bacterium]|nr:flagellar hook-associated protein FlgL [Nitrospiria bacterium]
MRVTEKILAQQAISELQSNAEQIAKLQQNLATGKKINQPSDDPVGTSQLLGFDVVQNKIDQYNRNLDSLDGSLKLTNTTLDAALQVLSTVKQVAMNQSTGSMTPEQIATASSQIQAGFDQLLQIANSTDNGQYLFSGFLTNVPAYDNSGAYQGDGGVNSVEAGVGVTIARNLPGQDVFGSASTGVDIFGLLNTLKTAIANNDQPTIQASLATLDQASNQVAQAQAELGVREQTLQTQQDRLKNLSSSVDQLRSKIEHADPAEIITKFQYQLTALQATQEATAKLLQTSLMDYLK